MGELKIITTGDRVAAQNYIKIAREQMGELKRSMIKPTMPHLNLQQGRLERRLFTDVTITCMSVFGIDTAVIYVEPKIVVGGNKEPKYKIEEEFYWYALNVSSLSDSLLLGSANPYSVDTDSMGNTYVVGVAKIGAAISTSDPVIIKYNPDGKFQWRKVILGSTSFDSGQAINYDNTTGNIYISYNKFNSSRGDGVWDCCLAKYDSDISLSWNKRLSLASDQNIDVLGWGSSIIQDTDVPANNRYTVVGRLNHRDACSYRAFIVQVNSSGAIVWQKNIGLFVDGDVRDCSGTGSWSEGDSTTDTYQRIEEPCHLEECATDSSNNTYAVGHHFSSLAYSDGLVMKFSSTGTLVWKVGIHGLKLQNNGLYGWYYDGIKATDVCVDSDDNVYVITHTHKVATDRCHINIFKFNSSGTVQWHRIVEVYADSSTTLEPMGNLCVDSSGLFVLFPRYSTGDNLYGMTVAKLDKSTGEPSWQRTLEMPSFDLYGSTIGGIRPFGITTCKDCLHIVGDIDSEQLAVTMKLPSVGFPTGVFRNLTISESTLTFYSDIASVPYLDEESGSGHYTMDIITSFDLDISGGAFTASTISTGDYESDNWGRTDKILKKETKTLI